MRSSRAVCVTVAALALALIPAPAFAQNGDTRVMNGSPTTPFSQNKQNEPAVAVDASHPNVVVAGANDNIDMEACNSGDDNTCPFTPGIGVSGVSFSFDNGHAWHQPTYRGLSARSCLGVPGPDPGCQPTVGPIGTLPKYYENGLVADGDPAVAFGPVYRNGHFDWANGTRLYYANLTSNLPGRQTFKGFEAIGVSRLDAPASTGLTPAIVDNQDNWQAPVIASKQNSGLFSDKEQVWADNAASSPFFGHTYVCNAAFRGIPGRSQPLIVATSKDGGSTWTDQQVTPATNNPVSPQGFGRSGCTIRTDSHGVVYVFVYQFGSGTPGTGFHTLITSHDGGKSWDKPRRLFPAVDLCNAVEPSIGRCVMDGVGGSRDDLGPAPSVDIANGAPTGTDATDQIIDAWTDGRDGLNHEHVFVSTSTDRGGTWTAPRSVESPGDRGYYAAPAFSPNGTDAWLVYNAFTTPFRNDSTSPRALVGVVKHADVSSGGGIGSFTTVHRGAPGDPRASSQNDLAAGFLGDYVYAAATRSYGAAVWNDVREAADCPAVDTYRQALHDQAVGTGQQTAEAEEPRGTEEAVRGSQPVQEPDAVAPDVQLACPATFGNSDIFGGSFADPTP